MSFVTRKTTHEPTPSSSEVYHDEHHHHGHHHVHHDEAHSGPGMDMYSHHEYHHDEPQPMEMRIMDPHQEKNQLFVRFTVDLIANPTTLNSSVDEQKEKLELDFYKAIEGAAKDQSLVIWDCAGNCYKSIDLKCMSGFVSKICIENYWNEFPFDVALDFPGTECAHRRNRDGTDAGTVIIHRNTPFCCEEKCVFEVKHKDSTKKNLGKYGSYKSPEELWHGCYDYGEVIHVPANCMGAHVVISNLYDVEKRPNGFRVSTRIVQTHSHHRHGYYAWPRTVIEKVNARFRGDVLPAIAGHLLDFDCDETYKVKLHRPDEKLEGKPQRDFASREGTVYERGNAAEGDTVFNTNHMMSADVRLVIGLTSKVKISPKEATGCCV